MKLINKINQQYLIFTFIIMMFLGIGIHLSMKILIAEEIDEKLEHTSDGIVKQIEKEKKLISLEPYIFTNIIESQKDAVYYSDTVVVDEKKEEEFFRQLLVIKNINEITYLIVVRESALESEDLLEAISILILISFLLLLSALIIVNRRVSKSVWSIFYTNLEKLKLFSLTELKPFVPNQSDIIEFNELNLVVKSLTERVIDDYEILKRFSEDASHELQTPLAIMRTKIEALLEENKLSQSQVEKIEKIYKSINRLSKINSGLLLLTKIENRQFASQELISVNELIKNQTENFTELMEIKEVELIYNFHSNWRFSGNIILMEILFNNLLGNAILHNIKGGQIIIDLFEDKLKISNTGNASISDEDKLFQRFYKGTETGSTGLGLAISKQICISQELKIHYSFQEKLHAFYVEKQ